MADINIYGRLWNQTTDGEIASAAQVKDSSFSKASEVDTSGSNPSQHDINEYLLDAIGTGGTASADALAQKVDKTTTINGKALDGDITLSASDLGIDTTLFKVVDTLPTSDIDTTKIYVVTSETTGTNNAYTEYIYVNSAWEKVGEYQASVDLSWYVKKENNYDNIATILKNTDDDGTTTVELFDNYIQFRNSSSEAQVSPEFSYMKSTTNSEQQVGAVLLPDYSLIYAGTIDETGTHTWVRNDCIVLYDGTNTKTITASSPEITEEEKAKLEGIEEGAEKNKNAFGKVYVVDEAQEIDEVFNALLEQDDFSLYAGDNIKFKVVKDINDDNTSDMEVHISCTATADEALTEEEIDAACA